MASLASAASAESARGGRPLVEAAADAPATVIGQVHDGVALDERAWFAWLEVERSLSGSFAPGERVAIAWDERVRERERRFADGDRILVALEPLPSWSIWRQRLGEREALGVARRGEAHVADPDEATVEGLAAWLARPESERGSLAALPELAALVASAEPTVARGALDRIDRLPGLAAALTPPASPAARAALGRALLDDARPERLRAAIVAVVGRRGLAVFRPQLAELVGSGSSLAPAAIAAQAALPGGVPESEARSLLERSEPEVRVAILRHAAGAVGDVALEARLADDPDPRVRAAAVQVWVARRGMRAFPRIAPLLADPNVPEGAAAVRALGALGEPAAAPLATLARDSSLDGARGPLLALTFAGSQGTLALRALAVDHDDPAVRAFATFLLGRSPPEH